MLTFALYWTILTLPLPHVADRIGVLELNGVSRINAVFLCAKSQFYIFMLGWAGSRKTDRFRLAGTPTCSARLHNWRYVFGVKNLINGVNKMTNNHTQSATRTEIQLIDLSQIIGSIADRNAMFTAGLSRYINDLGKPLPELTVSELAELTEQYCEAFNYGIEPSIKKVTVSPTKAKSLQKQHESIGHSLTIFCLEPNEMQRACLKSDALELVRMLDDLPVIPHKTSRFNVLSKSKRLIAKHVTYEQAMQYQNVSLKFAGMEYSS